MHLCILVGRQTYIGVSVQWGEVQWCLCEVQGELYIEVKGNSLLFVTITAKKKKNEEGRLEASGPA